MTQKKMKKIKEISNSTAMAVDVEANIPGTSAAFAHFLNKMRKNKLFDLKNECQGHRV